MKLLSKGGIFARFQTFPYSPKGSLIGQLSPTSCVAAVCRMILSDLGLEVPEAFLRTALETDAQGTLLNKIPNVLREFGVSENYELVKLESIDELAKFLIQRPAILVVKVADYDGLHVVLIDKIFKDFLYLRDSLPEGKGQAYRIRIEDFKPAWIQKKLGKGLAIVVN